MEKNKHKYFIILIILLSFIFIIPAHADSGWDSSYDSSSSWDSGSSWSSSDYGSSWDYDSSSSGDGVYIDNPYVGVIILTVIIIIVIAKIIENKNKPKVLAPFDSNKYVSSVPISSNIDISPEELQKYKEQTFDIYKKIQTAWMDFDYDTLRKYTTDELYNLYHTQLIALKAKKQQNIMKDFNLTSFNVVNLEQNDNSITLTVRMTVECYDYVVDKDQKVVRGTDKRKNIYNYEMTFIKGIDTVDNKCPNCNAPLENVNSSVCPYCDSTIINDNHDYVLSKKQMLNQRQK